MANSEERKEYQRAYARERYHWLKEHGICVKCGSEKAAKGKVRCEKCLEKGRIYLQENRAKYENYKNQRKERQKAYAHERYYRRKEHGICVQCGKKQAVKGKVYCKMCAANKREYTNALYRSKIVEDENFKNRYYEMAKKYSKKTRQYRSENHLCTMCGKPLADNDNHKKCSTCRAKVREKNYQWRIKNGLKTHEDRISGDYCYRCLKPLENPDRTKGAQLCERCLERMRARGKELGKLSNPNRKYKERAT